MNTEYIVLDEFVLARPNNADGDITMTKGSKFIPAENGFEGTPEELEGLIAAGTIAEVYTGPMAKYKITGEIEGLDESGEPNGQFLEIGSIHELPKEVDDNFIAEGKAEFFVEPTVQSGTEANADTAAEAPKPKMYMGKAIVSDSMRKVEDKQYHHIRLEDGSTHDLTAEDYKAVMEA